MAEKLGENIGREWRDDPFPQELWDAMQTLKIDRSSGLAELTGLAMRGSPLAMMYLGRRLVSSEMECELVQGEEWLTRSAIAGSIEGRLQLAVHYERQGKGDKAASELRALAAQGYLPAMYLLASMLIRGELIERDVPQAVSLLKAACAGGHLPSYALLARIYREHFSGFVWKLKSHWLCLAKIPALVWCLMTYPRSDRLRPFRS